MEVGGPELAGSPTSRGATRGDFMVPFRLRLSLRDVFFGVEPKMESLGEVLLSPLVHEGNNKKIAEMRSTAQVCK